MGGMINENKKSFNGCHNDSRFFVLRKPPDSLGVQCSFSDEK